MGLLQFVNCRITATVSQVSIWSQNFSSVLAGGGDGGDKTSLLRQRRLKAASLAQLSTTSPATAPREPTWSWSSLRAGLGSAGAGRLPPTSHVLANKQQHRKCTGSRKGEGRENVHYQNTLRAVLGNVQSASLYQTFISCEVHTGLFISPLKRTKLRGQLERLQRQHRDQYLAVLLKLSWYWYTTE